MESFFPLIKYQYIDVINSIEMLFHALLVPTPFLSHASFKDQVLFLRPCIHKRVPIAANGDREVKAWTYLYLAFISLVSLIPACVSG